MGCRLLCGAGQNRNSEKTVLYLAAQERLQ